MNKFAWNSNSYNVFDFVIHLYIYIWLYIYEINDSNDKKDMRKNKTFSYFKVLIQSMKWYSVIWNLTYLSCKCTLNTSEKPLVKSNRRSILDMTRKE